jgi:lysyl-tRNA synthetase, class I
LTAKAALFIVSTLFAHWAIRAFSFSQGHVMVLAATPAAESFAAALSQATAWPFEEARKLIRRVEATGKTEVVFETGYGPSGLPHIGTFGEVARTTMVRHAFKVLTEGKINTRLIAFSDDMDGLRKVPDNIPNKELIAAYLGKPLTQVPDPFGTHPSFGAHNNARLRGFLDEFGFDYDFASATDYYRSGRFDAALLHILAHYEEVMAIMLPSFREERAATYSPFLPIHPRTGVVMQVPIESTDAIAGTISWRDPSTQEKFETPVTGGACKLQWKPDWAMRWYALNVDYEMAGKDLIESVKLSGAIVRALGGMPPEGFNYELFLDERGQKISKSKGNGLTIEEWLTYASPESLSLFMYQKPTAAKRLYFDVIPRTVDDYLAFLDAYLRQEAKERLGNPVWHIHSGHPPPPEILRHGTSRTTISFGMLLNLATVANSEDPQVLWGFLRRYAPEVSPATHPRLDRLVTYAVRYYCDFVRPAKSYREPDEAEREALENLSAALSALPAGASAEEIQAVLYDVARKIPRYQDIKAKVATAGRPGVSNDWFAMLYRVLLGESRGPRFGSFVALYGLEETCKLIADALSGDLARKHASFDTRK